MLPSLTIVYGSASGCAAELTDRLACSAWQHGIDRAAIVCMAMDEYDVRQLPHAELVILVCSTQGQGEPPENAKRFYRFLLRRDLPADSLAHVHFTTFGLGDSSYPIFNAAARRLHQRMLDLGAHEFHPRGLGDDQDDMGYDQEFAPWNDQLWRTIRARYQIADEHMRQGALPPPTFDVVEVSSSSQLSSLPSSSSSDTPTWCPSVCQVDVPPFTISSPPCTTTTSTTTTTTLRAAPTQPSALPPILLPPRGGIGINAVRPTFARMVSNVRLTPATHFQDVRLIEFELPHNDDDKHSIATSTTTSLARWQPGDVIDVYPRNPPHLVHEFLHAMSWSPHTTVDISYAADLRDATTSATLPPLPFPPRCTLQELFELHLNLCGTPRRSFFSFLAHFATDPLHKEKLEEFASPEGQRDLWRYNQKEKRTYAEVLVEFASARPPLAALVSALPRLPPRSFSIASAWPRLEIVVALVEFVTPLRRTRRGLCSAFFAALDLHADSGAVYVPVHIKRGSFRLPAPAATSASGGDDGAVGVGWGGRPVIMCGPGTGVAPFRALCMQKAQAQALASAHAHSSSEAASAPARAYSPFYLFFGNRNRDADFLFARDWRHFVERGVLDCPVLTAFSRDQASKIYVQDVIAQDTPFAFQRGVHVHERERESADATAAPALPHVVPAQLVYDVLVQQRGYFVLAGASGAMPKAVRRALIRVLQERGAWTEEQATAFVREMEKDRRYVQEVW